MRHALWPTLSRWLQATCLGVWLGAGWVTLAQAAPQSATAERTLQPLVERARGGPCVEEPAFMRRNHMDLLRHQRVDVLRGGVRNGKYSLKECVACHASQTSGSVAAAPSDFCQSCHDYAGVKTDCFECHANKPMVKP